MGFLARCSIVSVVLAKVNLYHLLFVLVADFLQTMLNAAKQQGILSL
jgi:hypothetical protein